MRNTILILSISFFFVFSASGQWYNKHHGVNDPMLLSEEQLDFSSSKAKGIMTTGALVATAGSIGTVAGFITINNRPDGDWYPGQGLENSAHIGGGILLMALGVPLIVIGVLTIANGSDMASEIKKVRNMSSQNTGSLILSPGLIRGPQNTYNPEVRIILTF